MIDSCLLISLSTIWKQPWGFKPLDEVGSCTHSFCKKNNEIESFFFLKVKLPVTFFWQNVTKKFFGRSLNWVFSSFQNWITSLEPAWQQDFGTRRLSTGCGSLLKSGLELELGSGESKTGGAVWKRELYLDQSFQLSTPQHWNWKIPIWIFYVNLENIWKKILRQFETNPKLSPKSCLEPFETDHHTLSMLQ